MPPSPPFPAHLSKRHNVVFDVRPGDGSWILTVISDDDGDCGIEPSDAVDQILELVVTQERLGSYCNQSSDIVVCRDGW